MTTTKFRAELYPHVVNDVTRTDFRIIRKRNGKIVATSHGQGYSRKADAVRTLLELGIDRADIVDLTRR